MFFIYFLVSCVRKNVMQFFPITDIVKLSHLVRVAFNLFLHCNDTSKGLNLCDCPILEAFLGLKHKLLSSLKNHGLEKALFLVKMKKKNLEEIYCKW